MKLMCFFCVSVELLKSLLEKEVSKNERLKATLKRARFPPKHKYYLRERIIVKIYKSSDWFELVIDEDWLNELWLGRVKSLFWIEI
mgnify:CR=1 FL=1